MLDLQKGRKMKHFAKSSHQGTPQDKFRHKTVGDWDLVGPPVVTKIIGPPVLMGLPHIYETLIWSLARRKCILCCNKCPQVCCSFRCSMLGQASANACVLVCCSSELSDRFSFPATLLDKFSPSCAFLTIPQSGHWRWSRNRSNRNPEYINVQCSAQLTSYFGGRVGVLQLEMFSLQAQGRLMHIVKRLMHIGLMYIWSLHCETVNAHCM